MKNYVNQFEINGVYSISTSSGLWLVPTANPGAARRLGVATVIPAGFLDDGRQFVYSQNSRWLYFIDSQGMGQGRYVVSLDLQTGDTHKVLAPGESSGLWGFPPLMKGS